MQHISKVGRVARGLQISKRDFAADSTARYVYGRGSYIRRSD